MARTGSRDARAGSRLEALRQRIDELGLTGLVDGDAPGVEPFLTWRPPGHFYTPIPDLAEVDSDLDRLHHDDPLTGGIDLRPDAQDAFLTELTEAIGTWDLPSAPDAAWRYHAPNDHFGITDGTLLHGFLRARRPERVVEIGSGFSSALMLDTNDRYLDSSLSITLIEPYPEVLGTRLRPDDPDRITLIEQPVQEVDLDVFAELRDGDVLFIDSTHVAKTGSDVPFLFRHVVPRIAPGVHVHVHDIFWPFEYPSQWVREGRAWNELYVLEAFLRFNDSFQIDFFADWFQVHRRERLLELAPQCAAQGGGSIWLRRRAAEATATP